MAIQWNLDGAHSEVAFSVKHMAISKVKGKFTDFTSNITSESDDFHNAQVSFTAKIDSINTGNSDRDNHLKSADFFDAAQHPDLTFKSTSFTKEGSGDFKLVGDLTIHGVTHPITFSVEYGGTITDPYGLTRAGFELEGKLSRKEFGLTWSAVTEAGGLVVGDEIKLTANVEFTKQA